jgi:hypothetical protein
MKRFTIVAWGCLIALGFLASCGQFEDPLVVRAPIKTGIMQVTNGEPPSGVTVAVDLIAGRTLDVGSVTCWIAEEILYIRYDTDGEWSLAVTHLAVVEYKGDLPLTNSGAPKIGHFPLKSKHDPFTDTYTYSLDLEEWGFGDADELVVAAHAEVHILSSGGEILRSEGAWGEGELITSIVTDTEYQIERPAKSSTGRLELGRVSPGSWAMYFTIDINYLRGLILWNTLDSEFDVTHSRVGPDGVVVGDVAYLPCQHGCGFRPLERTGDRNIPDNYVEFDGLDLGQRGCIEFWYKPDFNNYDVGFCVDQFVYGIADPPTGEYFLGMGYNDWADLWGVASLDLEGPNIISMRTRPSTLPGWSTEVPFHIAVTWDGTEPDVKERLKFFVNGNRVTNLPDQHYTGDLKFENWTPDAVLRLASRTKSGDWNRHHWDAHVATIDNIKIWSYPKTDFSDRIIE